jgi:hypothetical protein
MYILCYKPVNTGDIFLLDAKSCHDYSFLVNTATTELKFPPNLNRHRAWRHVGGVAQEGEGPVSQPGCSTPGEISIGAHWIGGWEGPLHDVSCPSWGSNDSSAARACSPGNIRSGVSRLSISQYTSIVAYIEEQYPDLEINSYYY